MERWSGESGEKGPLKPANPAGSRLSGTLEREEPEERREELAEPQSGEIREGEIPRGFSGLNRGGFGFLGTKKARRLPEVRIDI